MKKTFLFGTISIEMYFAVLLKHQQLRSMTDHLAFLKLNCPAQHISVAEIKIALELQNPYYCN